MDLGLTFISAYQTINAAALLNTNQRLSDLQLSNILTFSSQTVFPDPLLSLRHNRFLRNRRNLKPGSPRKGFWMDPKLEKWEITPTSSLVIVKGSYKLRFQVKDFCVNIIECLQIAKVPIIWALPTMKKIDDSTLFSTLDLLKHLVWQVLKINTALQNESSMAAICARSQTASDEDHWFSILASVITGLDRLYVVIDVETLSGISAGSRSLPEAFLDLFSMLADRGSNTKMRIVLVSYISPFFSEMENPVVRDLILQVGSKARGTLVGSKGKQSKWLSLKARGNSK